MDSFRDSATTVAMIDLHPEGQIPYHHGYDIGPIPSVTGVTDLLMKYLSAGYHALHINNAGSLAILAAISHAHLPRPLVSMHAFSPIASLRHTFAEARSLFSSKDTEYAFGQEDDEGRKSIESFAAHHRSAIDFMPLEGRVYLLRQ